MGAGASIEDTGDLKKEYEKVKPNLTETQKTTLEETYKKVEGKNEFLIIGKCKKAYAELGIEGADPAFLPKEKKAAAPTKAPAPEPKKVQGPAPEGVTRFSLLDLPAVVKAAVESGKTPLILDPSEDGKVDTFYTYGKGARLLDAILEARAFGVIYLSNMAIAMSHSRRMLSSVARNVQCESALASMNWNYPTARGRRPEATRRPIGHRRAP